MRSVVEHPKGNAGAAIPQGFQTDLLLLLHWFGTSALPNRHEEHRFYFAASALLMWEILWNGFILKLESFVSSVANPLGIEVEILQRRSQLKARPEGQRHIRLATV